MKNERALSLLLAVMILLSSLPFAGVTAFAKTSGDFEYELRKDGTVEITGYTGSDKAIVIPTQIDGHTVTSIGARAFWNCLDITDITIGNEIVIISEDAFERCRNLKSVKLPQKLTTICGSAFEDCSSLTSINIPNSVTRIDHYAFSGCTKLSSITTSNNISRLGECVFDNTAYYNNEANWENGVLYIGKYLIKANNNFLITTADIKDGTITIANEAFSRCEYLLNVIMPNSLKYIGEFAFYGCNNLKNVIIGTGLKEIYEGVFNFCNNFEIYYRGSKSQWNKIIIDDANSWLFDAPIHYNYDPNATLDTPKIKSLTNTFLGVQIVWGDVKGALYYRVFRKTGNGSWVALGDTDTPNVIDISAESGNKYTYTIRCVSKDGKTYLSSYDTVGKSINYIEAPYITQVSNTATGIQVKWDKANGAAKYRVYYKTSGGSWTKIADTTSTSYTWTGAKSGTNYTFTVRCITSDGKSFTSDYDPYGLSLKYIAAPKISSLSSAATGIQINWGKVTGAEKYRVYYKTGNDSWTRIADTTGTSYTWTGAKVGTNYTFTVRCITSDAKNFTSGYDSTGKSITTIATPKLSSVENTATGVKITWGKVSGAEKYRVYYKTGNGSWTKIADTTSTSYTWTGAKSGTNYTFTVRCLSNDGKTFTSGYDTTGKSIKYISAPKLSSVENTATGVKITWGKVSGAEKYRVYYKSANGWTKIADTTSTSYTWTGAKSGTKYTFTVRCLNSAATAFTSSFDSTGKSITFLSAPKISSLSKTSSGITIKWGAVTGAAKYRVYYKTANGWTKIADTTSTSYTWTGGKTGTNYTFTVRCISSDGKSFTSGYDATGKSITK